MKLQFSDPKITEYYEGGIHQINDGEPFEVPSSQGEEMLKAYHWRTDAEGERYRISVFVKVESDETDAGEEKEDPKTPDSVETLAKLPRPELEKMAVDLKLDGNTYTNRRELAVAILAAKQEAE